MLVGSVLYSQLHCGQFFVLAPVCVWLAGSFARCVDVCVFFIDSRLAVKSFVRQLTTPAMNGRHHVEPTTTRFPPLVCHASHVSRSERPVSEQAASLALLAYAAATAFHALFVLGRPRLASSVCACVCVPPVFPPFQLSAV